MENEERWLAAAAAGEWSLDVPRLQERFPAPTLSSSPDSGSLELFKFLAQDGLLFPDESTDDGWFVVPGNASVANSILAQAVRTELPERPEPTPRMSHEGMRAAIDMLAQRSPEIKFDTNIKKYLDERLLDELEREGFFKKMAQKN